MMAVTGFEVLTGETVRASFVPMAFVATAGITYESVADGERYPHLAMPVAENINPDGLRAPAFGPDDGPPAA